MNHIDLVYWLNMNELELSELGRQFTSAKEDLLDMAQSTLLLL